MIWFRFIMIGMFSLTAGYLFYFQGVEIFHAFIDFFNKKE
ncbi:hypothetical protein JOC33_002403 [Thalassobacillus pellis]|nr:hypothetical protein [Thalassobacillus pellis]